MTARELASWYMSMTQKELYYHMNASEVQIVARALLVANEVTARLRQLVSDLAQGLDDEGGSWSQEGLDDLRNRVTKETQSACEWSTPSAFDGVKLRDLDPKTAELIRFAVFHEREAIIALLPGGTHCDPQEIADAIRSRGKP